MNQVLFGAAFAFLFALVVYACRRGRASLPLLALTPLGMAAGAFWAHIPDLPRLVGQYDLYLRWSNDPRMNIFLWHYAIDRVEVHAGWHVAATLALLAGLLGAAWRELRLREQA